MITYPNGQKEKSFLSINEAVQRVESDEYLYRYLLRNTALKAYDEGLPDEEQKVLKHFGVKYWEPGMEEVRFAGTIYKVVMRDEL
jgi:hypothetical protein